MIFDCKALIQWYGSNGHLAADMRLEVMQNSNCRTVSDFCPVVVSVLFGS